MFRLRSKRERQAKKQQRADAERRAREEFERDRDERWKTFEAASRRRRAHFLALRQAQFERDLAAQKEMIKEAVREVLAEQRSEKEEEE